LTPRSLDQNLTELEGSSAYMEVVYHCSKDTDRFRCTACSQEGKSNLHSKEADKTGVHRTLMSHKGSCKSLSKFHPMPNIHMFCMESRSSSDLIRFYASMATHTMTYRFHYNMSILPPSMGSAGHATIFTTNYVRKIAVVAARSIPV